ncbi:MAG: GNAT family N-acetyltransferase [Dehalococcoidales bacterium]|nr:GNAT family N-acetyltransferase [Dehalococcoidales bacterium]
MNSTSRAPLRIEEISLGSPRIKLFADLPWHIHRGDPCWTPPLRGDLLGNRWLGLVGLLTPKHPYHRDAEVTHFLAWRDGKAVGRVSAAINRRFNEYHGTRIGFFGFWDVIEDYAVAKALLERACAWVKERGMTVIRGPGEYSNATHERQGILIDGFEYPPTVELTHNPPYYADFLERYGFGKAKDYHAYIMDVQTPPPPRLQRLAEQVRQRRDIETRPLILKHLQKEVHLIVKIYNDSWAQNWGFLPITDEEAILLANSLRLIVDPGLVQFAFVRGEPAAVLGAFPDPNYALRPRWRWYGDSDLIRLIRLLRKRRHTGRTRLMFFGIRPGFRNLGIDALLYERVKNYAIGKGYSTCEASLLLEDNHLILRPSEFMGAKRYKTWRIYDLPLD